MKKDEVLKWRKVWMWDPCSFEAQTSFSLLYFPHSTRFNSRDGKFILWSEQELILKNYFKLLIYKLVIGVSK